MPFGKQTKVIKRQSHEENTFAVVHWVGVRQASLLEAVTKSVTRWVSETPSGKECWEYSGGDLNLGDLSSYLDDEALVAILAANGVHDLEVDCHSDDDPEEEWTYDTVLVDEAALKTEGDE